MSTTQPHVTASIRGTRQLSAPPGLADRRAMTALRLDGLDDGAGRGAALAILDQIIAAPRHTDDGELLRAGHH